MHLLKKNVWKLLLEIKGLPTILKVQTLQIIPQHQFKIETPLSKHEIKLMDRLNKDFFKTE